MEREREGERDRDRDRQTDRQTETERENSLSYMSLTCTESQFVQLLQFHLLLSVRFHYGYFFGQSPRLF